MSEAEMVKTIMRRIQDTATGRVRTEQVVTSAFGCITIGKRTYVALMNDTERCRRGYPRYYKRQDGAHGTYLYVDGDLNSTTIGFFFPNKPEDLVRSHFVPVDRGPVMICNLPRDDVWFWSGHQQQAAVVARTARNERILSESVSGPYALKPAEGPLKKLITTMLG
jgi:hypothetical protein